MMSWDWKDLFTSRMNSDTATLSFLIYMAYQLTSSAITITHISCITNITKDLYQNILHQYSNNCNKLFMCQCYLFSHLTMFTILHLIFTDKRQGRHHTIWVVKSKSDANNTKLRLLLLLLLSEIENFHCELWISDLSYSGTCDNNIK